MARFKVGIQLYSVREDMEKDFRGTLEKVKAMGYDGVEFAGIFDKTAAEVKAMCEEIGLIPISAHVNYTDMVEDMDILKVYSNIGCEYVAIPYAEEEFRCGTARFDEFIENTKLIGAKAKELGMTLCYHNHDFEFEKIDGVYALDTIYNRIPKELLETELDTCWVNVGGEDPCKYIIKYGDRANIIHLKDFVGSKSDNMYELIGLGEGKNTTAQGFGFRPVGYGVQNFNDILNAAEEVNAKWVIVEQDRPSLDKTPMECAEMSINYLKDII